MSTTINEIIDTPVKNNVNIAAKTNPAHLFNMSSAQFLLDAGLKPGMKVLDIGCGDGLLTAWVAQQVGPSGSVIAIDNDDKPLMKAQKRMHEHDIDNVELRLLSAYNLFSLDTDFDLILCRFTLNYVVRPGEVIDAVFDHLKPGGIIVAEAQIKNQAFTYPFTPAWGEQRWKVKPEAHELNDKKRDDNFGLKLHHTLHQTGFGELKTQLYQPMLCSKEDKTLCLGHMIADKAAFLRWGHTEKEWQEHLAAITHLLDDSGVAIAYHQSCLVSGSK